MMEEKMKSTFLIAIILATTCVARADLVSTVDIEHTGYGASGRLRVWGGGLHGVRVRGGVYMFNKSDGTNYGELWDDGPLGAVCIELSQCVPTSPTAYDVVMPEQAQNPSTFLGGPIGAEKAGYLAELWGRFFDSSWVGSGPFTRQQKSDAEAFAAAVWEIVYEDLPDSPAGWNVTVDGTAGNRGFRCTNADTTTANAWLWSLDSSNRADLRALDNCKKQDYITALPITQIPEPATIALLGLGALSLLRRKQSV
jgi:hypothetical protein